jgi:hypothetical protein
MNLRENIPVNFLGKKLKWLIAKLMQSPNYYPIKHNGKVYRRHGNHHGLMW